MTLAVLPLALGLTALAQTASAFGAMDCVGSDYCRTDGCTQSFMVLGITFDWTAQSATVEMAGETTRLDLAMNDLSADMSSGALTYINTDNAGMILEFDAQGIEMTLYSSDGISHIAACSAREAA
ncbi:hypothetical protein [Gymnodinialimonas hymeniacidonis]|uniref:hypothetical protein n=1 Tax=Gymnodinialimonas hymeniacidonis TaxID=3126508 RepID=UPI0034C60862